jgi:subtilase family serine protease
MRTEGYGNCARSLAVLAALFVFSSTANGQHVLTILPPSSVGDGHPISFMRPFYQLHHVEEVTASGPPTSAFTPAKIRHAYGFDLVSNQGTGQIIGIADAYDDPNAEADLTVFDAQFGLPACTSSNGCFRKIYGNGHKPATNSNWSVEIALDVEWAHAIAPRAMIVLVEAPSNSLGDLLKAVDTAVQNGASVVSMSWTTGEFSGETSLDNHFASNSVAFFAAAGDSGTGVVYPAASPFVVGVGGTSLMLDANGNYQSERAWSGSGGGLSSLEHEPLFQAQFGIPNDSHGRRGAPDVSYNANPGAGYAVYDSVGINGGSGWFQVGGTSAAAPQWAALVAIANSMRVGARKANLAGTNTILYSLAKANVGTYFHPVTQGTNGSCGLICDAEPGYDYITGLGTPPANVLIAAFVAQK